MATYTVNSADSRIRYQNANWTTCRNASIGTAVYPTETVSWFASIYSSGSGDYYIDRWAGYFSTIAIPNTATISAASFHIYVDDTDYSGDIFYLVEWTEGILLTTADYDGFETTLFGSASAGSVGWKTITLNQDGKDHINVYGDTQLFLRNRRDYNNNTPTDLTASEIRTGDYGSYEPYLSVTYYLDGTSEHSSEFDIVSASNNHSEFEVTGLILSYDLDEETGTVANDDSDISNDGTITGATWTTLDEISKKVLRFDGTTSDYVTSDTNIQDLDDVTFSVWVKIDDVSYDNYWAWIGGGFDIGFGNLNKWVSYFLATTDDPSHKSNWSAQQTIELEDNKWYHVVLTYDSTTSTINGYIDKSLQFTSTTEVSGTIEESTGPLYLSSYTGSYPIEGYLRKFNLYSHAIDQTKVNSLFADGSADITRDVTHGSEFDIYATSIHGSEFEIIYLSKHHSEVTIAHFDSSEHGSSFLIYDVGSSQHHADFDVVGPSSHYSTFIIYAESIHQSEFDIMAEEPHQSTFKILGTFAQWEMDDYGTSTISDDSDVNQDVSITGSAYSWDTSGDGWHLESGEYALNFNSGSTYGEWTYDYSDWFDDDFTLSFWLNHEEGLAEVISFYVQAWLSVETYKTGEQCGVKVDIWCGGVQVESLYHSNIKLKNKWFHVVFIKEGTSGKLYVNNVLRDTVVLDSTDIGDRGSHEINKFTWGDYSGYLNKVRMYNYPFTQLQIEQLNSSDLGDYNFHAIHQSQVEILGISNNHSEFNIIGRQFHYSEFFIHLGHNTTFSILGHAVDGIQPENRDFFAREMKNLFPKWIKPEPDSQLEQIQDGFLYELYYSLQLIHYIKDYLNIDDAFVFSSVTNNIEQNVILDSLFTHIYNRQRYDNESDEHLRDRIINYMSNFIGGGNIEQWRNSLERMFDLPDDERIRGYEPCKAYYSEDIFAGETQVTTFEHPEAIGYSHSDSLRYIWDDEDDLTLGGTTSESWRFELADARKIATFQLELPLEYEATIGGADGGIEAFYADKIDTPFASIIDVYDDDLKANVNIDVKEDLNIYYIDLEDYDYYSGMEPLYELPYGNLSQPLDYDPETFIKFADYLKYHISSYYTWGAQWDHDSNFFVVKGSNNWTWFKVAHFDSMEHSSLFYYYGIYTDYADTSGRAVNKTVYGPVDDWDDCRGASSGDNVTVELVIQAKYISTGDGSWTCSRGFISFTNTLLGGSGKVLKATLKMKSSGLTRTPDIMIQKWNAADKTVAVGDYNDGSTNLLDSSVEITAIDTWYDFEFNQTGLDHITDSLNNNGYVLFAIKEYYYDVLGNNPSSDNRVEFVDCTQTYFRPILYLEYVP